MKVELSDEKIVLVVSAAQRDCVSERFRIPNSDFLLWKAYFYLVFSKHICFYLNQRLKCSKIISVLSILNLYI